MGAAGATAAHLQKPSSDDGALGEVLVSAITSSIATAGVIAISESLDFKNKLANTTVMFLAGTTLLYALKKHSK